VPWYDAFGAADDRSIPATLLRPPSTDAVPTTADALGLPARMDGDGPLVSVVVPTHDDDHCLPAALQTVGAQTHRTLELLLVDADDTPWLAALADDRPWIRRRSGGATGPSAARNDGIAAADGEYVALLDADDYWHPDKLRRQLDALDTGDAVAYCDSYVVDLREESPVVWVAGGAPTSRERAHAERVVGGLDAHTSTLLFERDAVARRPFDESLDNYEDVTFMVELFDRCPPVHVPAPLSVRRWRRGSHGRLADASGPTGYLDKLRAVEQLVERYPELAPRLTRRREQVRTSVGMAHLRAGRDGAAREHLARSLLSGELGLESYKPLGLYVGAVLPVDGRGWVRGLERVQAALSSVHRPLRRGEQEDQVAVREQPGRTTEDG
jgi:hypothetical protein